MTFYEFKLTEDLPGELETFERVSRNDYLRKAGKTKARKLRRIASLRADYGLVVSDYWDFLYHGSSVLAAVLRSVNTPAAEKLLTHLIAAYDDSTSNSMTHYVDPDKHKSEADKWYAETESKMKLAKDEWASLWLEIAGSSPRSSLPAGDYAFDLDAAHHVTPRFTSSWSEWRGVYTDPVTLFVPEKDLAKHRKQRVLRGYSDQDLAIAPMQYVAWLFTNALTWYSSNAPVGYSPERGWEGDAQFWVEKIPVFVHLTFNPSLVGLSEAEKAAVKDTLSQMPSWLGSLWD